MAHLESRGQLVLVTALAVAAALVGLVVLVNLAIYTENLATRDAGVEGGDVLAFRDAVVEGTGQLVDTRNAAEHDTETAVRDAVDADVDRLESLLTRQHVEAGTYAGLGDARTYHAGRLVRQGDPTRNFTDASGVRTDWVLAVAVTDVRAVDLTVDRESLVPTNESAVASSDAFRVVVDANTTANSWTAYVYENVSTSDISVAVEPPGGTPTEVCSVDRDRAAVSPTSGRLGDEPCPGLRWGQGVTTAYDVEFRNGDAAAGTYNLTVNVSAATASVTTPLVVNDDPADGDPYAVPAVYDATLTVTYESEAVSYTDTVRIAPGEAGG